MIGSGIPVLQSPQETLLISGDTPKFSLLLRLGQRIFPATLASRAELPRNTLATVLGQTVQHAA